jgi:hypothetical protein
VLCIIKSGRRAAPAPQDTFLRFYPPISRECQQFDRFFLLGLHSEARFMPIKQWFMPNSPALLATFSPGRREGLHDEPETLFEEAIRVENQLRGAKAAGRKYAA